MSTPTEYLEYERRLSALVKKLQPYRDFNITLEQTQGLLPVSVQQAEIQHLAFCLYYGIPQAKALEAMISPISKSYKLLKSLIERPVRCSRKLSPVCT